MVYIQIGSQRYPCEIGVFHTQIGTKAVRIKSDAPVAINGFKLFNDDIEIADMSDYTHLYREDGSIKEYTQTADQIIPAESSTDPVPKNPITQALSNLNNRVTDITPYTQSKKAYYGEIEKVFYGVPSGDMSVFFDNEYTTERIEDRVYVRFERLTETKDITIMVQ